MICPTKIVENRLDLLHFQGSFFLERGYSLYMLR